MISATSSAPFTKRWTTDDDKVFGPPADRRKPRTYASLKPGFDNTLYPLDFCLWLHRQFDGLVAAINSGRLREFSTW